MIKQLILLSSWQMAIDELVCFQMGCNSTILSLPLVSKLPSKTVTLVIEIRLFIFSECFWYPKMGSSLRTAMKVSCNGLPEEHYECSTFCFSQTSKDFNSWGKTSISASFFKFKTTLSFLKEENQKQPTHFPNSQKNFYCWKNRIRN
jgi:hypothetical protein